MKKNLIVLFIALMMIPVIGCSKKYVKGPEEPGVTTGKETAKEEVMMPEQVEKEVVEETPIAREEEVEENVLSLEEAAKSIFKDVLFDYDKYEIRSDARPILDSVASFLRDNGNLDIIIEGHCDERGTNEYNLALGERRAKATKNYLVSLGISPDRINVVTYGEEKPLCIEQTESCWQRNRRAHFVVGE